MAPGKRGESLQASPRSALGPETACTCQRWRFGRGHSGRTASRSGWSYADCFGTSVWGGSNWLFAPSTNSEPLYLKFLSH